MKLDFKNIVSKYLNSGFIPFFTFLLMGFLLVFLSKFFYLTILSVILPFVLIVSFAGILLAALWNFRKKRWLPGVLNLVIFVAPFIIFVFCFRSFLVSSKRNLSGSVRGDSFGRDIVIPPDLHMEEPLSDQVMVVNSATDPAMDPALDPEGKALAKIFAQKEKWPLKAIINTNIDMLNMFSGDKRNLLLRHLASSAKWYLTKENGKLYAYRRFFKIGDRWQIFLNGFCSCHDIDPFQDESCQIRILLGIDGPLLTRSMEHSITKAKVGSGTVALKVDKSLNQGYVSYLVVTSQGPSVEIFEEADTRQRPFTPLALSFLEKELKALFESSDAREKGFDAKLMPPESVINGAPEIYITGRGGIYNVYAYVNPGEPGYAYLKVFEETRNTPLSEILIVRNSTEYIGWSENTDEKFFYNTMVRVYEGSNGIYYPARLELWFVPESGKPERKLIEKVFKIEGWEF